MPDLIDEDAVSHEVNRSQRRALLGFGAYQNWPYTLPKNQNLHHVVVQSEHATNSKGQMSAWRGVLPLHLVALKTSTNAISAARSFIQNGLNQCNHSHILECCVHEIELEPPQIGRPPHIQVCAWRSCENN